MNPRRFVLEIDGERFYAAAWPSESERENAIAGAVVPESSPPLAPVDDEVRPPGRPSFDDLIGAAMEPIEAELEELPTTAARARRVLKRIAQEAAPADIPSRDTVERFLRDRPPRQKPRQNCRQNSRRSKITSGG